MFKELRFWFSLALLMIVCFSISENPGAIGFILVISTALSEALPVFGVKPDETGLERILDGYTFVLKS